MRKRALEQKVDALRTLRTTVGADGAREPLRQALGDRNNYVVARTAAIIADARDEALIPELVAAFERFFVDPVRTDPHCLAKLALARALRDLSCRDAHVFLRGITHVQREPAWGGPADTAAELRGTCALALTSCPLDDLTILTYLTDGLADPAKEMRLDCAVAIAQLNRREGALVLRLKLLSGDAEHDVLGQCFAALLSVAGDEAVAFIRRFLDAEDVTVQLEAASALAQSREVAALPLLREFWQTAGLSAELRRTVVVSLGASPLPEASTFLLELVAEAAPDLAAAAIGALASSRFRNDAQQRLAATLAQRPELQAAYQRYFPAAQ